MKYRKKSIRRKKSQIKRKNDGDFDFKNFLGLKRRLQPLQTEKIVEKTYT